MVGKHVEGCFVDYKVVMYNRENLLAILEEIGFSEIKLHKTFDIGKAPDDNDEMVVYECRKQQRSI